MNELKKQNIPFKQSKMFITPKVYKPATTGREINIDTRDFSDQTTHNASKEDEILLFNDNPQLVNEQINPTFKVSKKEKPLYVSKNYVLGEYAMILKKNRADMTNEQSGRIENGVDWIRMKTMITDEYNGLAGVNIRSTRGSMHLSDLGSSNMTDATDRESMSGIGVAGLTSRRAMLKHEFDKLRGEAGLGNDSRRVARELKLIRRIF